MAEYQPGADGKVAEIRSGLRAGAVVAASGSFVLKAEQGEPSLRLWIRPFADDEAGQKAALKAFEGEQSISGQTFVAIAPDGMDPCELRQEKGDAAVRDLVARRVPMFEFAIRSMLEDYDLDHAEGRVEALRRTVPVPARQGTTQDSSARSTMSMARSTPAQKPRGCASPRPAPFRTICPTAGV